MLCCAFFEVVDIYPKWKMSSAKIIWDNFFFFRSVESSASHLRQGEAAGPVRRLGKQDGACVFHRSVRRTTERESLQFCCCCFLMSNLVKWKCCREKSVNAGNIQDFFLFFFFLMSKAQHTESREHFVSCNFCCETFISTHYVSDGNSCSRVVLSTCMGGGVRGLSCPSVSETKPPTSVKQNHQSQTEPLVSQNKTPQVLTKTLTHKVQTAWNNTGPLEVRASLNPSPSPLRPHTGRATRRTFEWCCLRAVCTLLQVPFVCIALRVTWRILCERGQSEGQIGISGG